MSADNGLILEGGDSMISDRDDRTTTPTPDAGPVRNPDVIGHLCKFLAPSDIKNCRLVSSSWNYGSTPVLKARTRTDLNFSPGYDKNYKHFGPDLGGWDITDVVKKLEFGPINIRLALPSTHDYNLAPPDFSIFPFDNNFKSIFVQYPFGEEQFHWQRGLFTKFILASSSTLVELKSEWTEDEDPLDFPPLGGTVFPKLTKLKVRLFPEEDETVKRIGHAIATSFPNLQYLEARCGHLVAIEDEGQLANFPRFLTSLELGGDLDTNGFECLLKIPASLKKLVFGNPDPISCELDDRVDELPTIFYKLLKKHAPTLEELHIGINWMNRGKKLEWKFPVFPILKELWIGFADKGDMITTIVFETDIESGYFGPINYPICFPVLESLHMFCIMDESRVKSFLPSEVNGQVCASVKEVDVSIYEYPGVIIRTKIYARLLSLFPNAREGVITDLQRLLDLV